MSKIKEQKEVIENLIKATVLVATGSEITLVNEIEENSVFHYRKGRNLLALFTSDFGGYIVESNGQATPDYEIDAAVEVFINKIKELND